MFRLREKPFTRTRQLPGTKVMVGAMNSDRYCTEHKLIPGSYIVKFGASTPAKLVLDMYSSKSWCKPRYIANSAAAARYIGTRYIRLPGTST